MESILNFTLLFLLGGIGGLLAGLLGIGGGIIYVIIFNHFLLKLGLPPTIIVPSIIANSMFAILFAGISGTYKQWKNKNFHPKEMLITGISATLSSIVFSIIISSGTWYTKEKFSVLFITLLLLIAIRLFTQRKKSEELENVNVKWHSLSLTGLISGTIAAFSGIGGGVIIVPILSDIIKIPIKKATSISLGVISIMALFTSLYHMMTTQSINNGHSLIVFSLAIPVALGSLVASPFGVSISSKLKPQQIRLILLIFLLLVITKMILSL